MFYLIFTGFFYEIVNFVGCFYWFYFVFNKIY